MNYILIISSFLIAMAGLFKDSFPQKRKRLITLFILVPLTAICGSQIYIELNTWRTKWHGTLTSTEKSNGKFPVLVLGKSNLVKKSSPNVPIIDMAGEPLYLKLIDGEAKLSLAIRDEYGKVLGIIRDNEWFVSRPPSVLDRNFDKNKLEIINDKNEIIFQLIIEGEKAYLAGRFYSKEGIGPTTIKPFLNEQYGLSDTLFKYPSERYPNELKNKNL